jgi:[ribosomal protein S5]-alanine N-acetyltransferase
MLGQLHSSRLLLRDVTLEDAPSFLQLDQDPEVMRFLGGVRADKDVAHMQGVIAERIEWYSKTPGLGLGACFLQTNPAGGPAGSTAEFIGWFMLRPRKYRPYDASGALLAPVEDAELGYRLARRYWGQGYATEMSRELVRHGLEQLALPQIVAFVDAQHLASVRVLQKAGLRHAGRARYEADDEELYRISVAKR